MLKKDITYENPFTGEQVTETHYFHISKADLVEMQMEEHQDKYVKDGVEYTGMQAKLQRIVDAEDAKAIMDQMKDLIRRSYGKKDGDRFVKSKAVWEEFSSTEAYSQLFYELCTDGEKSSEFVNGIVPANLVEQVAEEARQQVDKAAPKGRQTTSKTTNDKSASEPRVLSKAQLEKMDPTELKAGLADGRFKLS